ncbi:MAG: exonuclease domain-containing protein [Acidobacteria bacterium]|nr:exonuclease domain-containing protein [Acidobacteriota bacterium]
MADTFVAIDLETANPDLASICQIAAVTFTDGAVTDSWQTLVDPEDYFHPVNVSIHGIVASAVVGAPRFVDVAPQLAELLERRIVASHTGFDRVALSQAQGKHGLPPIGCQWIDTARVSRRAWPQFARSGYGLAKVARHCGIEFQHHDAAEDARAAGEILVRAMSEHRLGLSEWLARVNQPINPREPNAPQGPERAGNPDGELFGEVVVFTGALSMLRSDAANMAAEAGCNVAASVGKTTTILVVGDTDVRSLAGHEKSSKHRKAEELIMQGQPLRILCERDFLALLRVGS